MLQLPCGWHALVQAAAARAGVTLSVPPLIILIIFVIIILILQQQQQDASACQTWDDNGNCACS